MQEGGWAKLDENSSIIYQLVSDVFYPVARRPKDLVRTKHLILPVEYHGSVHCSHDETWSQWRLMNRSSLSTFTMDGGKL